MLNPVLEMPAKEKKGGGLFGKILGGAVGLGAAALTGGAALPAVGAGMTAGGILGETVKPTTYSGGTNKLQIMANEDPEVGYLNVKKAQEDLIMDNSFSPEEKDSLNSVLERGKDYYRKQIGGFNATNNQAK